MKYHLVIMNLETKYQTLTSQTNYGMSPILLSKLGANADQTHRLAAAMLEQDFPYSFIELKTGLKQRKLETGLRALKMIRIRCVDDKGEVVYTSHA